MLVFQTIIQISLFMILAFLKEWLEFYYLWLKHFSLKTDSSSIPTFFQEQHIFSWEWMFTYSTKHIKLS